jgi:dihydrofolate reductase
MRKLVVRQLVSVDGVAEAPQRWHRRYRDYELEAEVAAGFARADALLLGSRTYQDRAAFWPGPAPDLAEYLDLVRKYVVSGTLRTADWQNTTLIPAADALPRIAELKRQSGKDILVTGSLTLCAALLRAGLVDEVCLVVHPLVLGTGRRVFDAPPRTPLRLVSTRTHRNGVQFVVYRPLDQEGIRAS